MLKRSEYERNEILRIAKYDFSSKDFASMLKWRNHHMIATNTTADFDRYKRVGLTQKTIDHGYMQSTSIQIEASCKDLKHDEIIHETLYG